MNRLIDQLLEHVSKANDPDRVEVCIADIHSVDAISGEFYNEVLESCIVPATDGGIDGGQVILLSDQGDEFPGGEVHPGEDAGADDLEVSGAQVSDEPLCVVEDGEAADALLVHESEGVDHLRVCGHGDDVPCAHVEIRDRAVSLLLRQNQVWSVREERHYGGLAQHAHERVRRAYYRNAVEVLLGKELDGFLDAGS